MSQGSQAPAPSAPAEKKNNGLGAEGALRLVNDAANLVKDTKPSRTTADQKMETIIGAVEKACTQLITGGNTKDAIEAATVTIVVAAVSCIPVYGPVLGALTSLIAQTGVFGEIIDWFDGPEPVKLGYRRCIGINTAMLAAGLPLKFPHAALGSEFEYKRYPIPLSKGNLRRHATRLLRAAGAHLQLMERYAGTGAILDVKKSHRKQANDFILKEASYVIGKLTGKKGPKIDSLREQIKKFEPTFKDD